MNRKKKQNLFLYFTQNILVVAGVVFIWRGIWLLLDMADEAFFGGNRWFTAVGGIIGGLLILYLPDKDLSEIEKL